MRIFFGIAVSGKMFRYGEQAHLLDPAALCLRFARRDVFVDVLQLVGEGRVALDEKVSRYLGHEPWYSGIPNGETINVRMLLNHTSGIPEYGGDFMTSLIREPGRRRSPLDAVKSVAGAKPLFPAGTAFSYTDVNFQLLQLLAERVTSRPAYSEIRRRLLEPLRLSGIVPADQRSIPGLVPG